jgi:cobaltochelatase CobS
MYENYDLLGTPIGASDDGENGITVHTDLGRQFPAPDLTRADNLRLLADLSGVDKAVEGWYAGLSTGDVPDGIGGSGGDGETGEPGEAGTPGEPGEPTDGEAADGEPIDGEAADGETGETGENENGDAEPGDDDDEKKDEPKMPEMKTPEYDEPGELDGLNGDELLQEIWQKLAPLVEGRDRAGLAAMAEYVTDSIKAAPRGGPAGDTIIKISGGKVGKVTGDTHEVFQKVLAAVARGVNVYLPGPPGTGKSHMVGQIAEALDRPYAVVSFSPMSTESKLLGYYDATGNYVGTPFRKTYEEGGVICCDELDNANPAIVAVLNGGIAQDYMGFPDGLVKRHPDFVMVATANTLGTGPTAEFAGRQKLDPATLNRLAKIPVGTDERLETKIICDMIGESKGVQWLEKVRHVRRACEELRIKHFVTMRDSRNGAMLIAPGAGAFTQLEALQATCLGSLSPDQVDKIKAFKA